MKCAKLHLQERSKTKANKTCNEKPRRFCQKRLVNPEHEEDPRWSDVYERYYCYKSENCDLNETNDSEKANQAREDLFLSVQTLQFQGDVNQMRRPRTSFKYKSLPDSQKHRMFVKQTVENSYQNEPERSSVLSDYANNYTKYFSNNDQSRPSSSKSSIILYYLSDKSKENKSTQVDIKNAKPKKKRREKVNKIEKRPAFEDLAEDFKLTKNDNTTEDTKISYHKCGKRKSLTISRTESPATVQVIRVDVVCNYSCSSTMSDYDECKKESCSIYTEQEDKDNKTIKSNRSPFTNKYVLTNTVKTLDENVTGGKVTLMCKTFKLADRTKTFLDSKQTTPVSTAKLNKSKVLK